MSAGPDAHGAELPSFSVIVPTRNRPDQLRSCVEALAGLDYPRNRFQVIVVDDGSDISLNPVLEPAPDSLDLTLVEDGHRGQAAARNAAAARARGSFLAFTDDDCRPDPGWLRAFARSLAGSTDRAVCGHTLNALEPNPYAAASQAVTEIVHRHYNANPEGARFFASNNLALPAGGFRRVGGFDPSFRAAEDRELADRWLHEGYAIAHVPDAVVHHANDLTLSSFCRQHFGYGRGAYHFHRARAQRGSGRLRDELGFYRTLAEHARRAVSASGVGTWRGAVLLTLWQLTNAAGYAWEGVRAAAGDRVRVE